MLKNHIFLLLISACSDYQIVPNENGDVPIEIPPFLDSKPLGLDTGSEPCENWTPPDPFEASIDESCSYQPEPGNFDPVIEWQSADMVFADKPSFTRPYVMPVVANLSDDNGDGLINQLDIPDIVYSAFETTNSYNTPGVLRALSGDGSHEIFTITEFDYNGIGYQPSGYIGSGTAVGDIDADGLIDVVSTVIPLNNPVRTSSAGYLAAFDQQGHVKWVSTEINVSTCGYPSIADMDGDGDGEITMGAAIFDHNGKLLLDGNLGIGLRNDKSPDLWGPISVPADLDNDGIMELITGNTVYALDGRIVWTQPTPDGYPAIADMDNDGQPEIVTVAGSTGEIYLYDGDGLILWVVPFEYGAGGPPTIADFDGDGAPEIGVAGKYTYQVFNHDGSVLWQTSITDVSSSSTGSSVFDFEGDGKAEVVFADEVAFYIFDGKNGNTLFKENRHTHGTAAEYPIVVDVDNDGQAEIVLGSSNFKNQTGEWDGITVLGNRDQSWAKAGPIWNQHAFSITNISTDGSIPVSPTPNWLDTNTFRAGNQQLAEGVALPNLKIGQTDRCTEACNQNSVLLAFSLANSGLFTSGDYTVELKQITSSSQIVVISEQLSSLASGESIVLGPYDLTKDDWGDELRIYVDSTEQSDECDETDNVMSLGPWPCD